jgi:hypothetical protein
MTDKRPGETWESFADRLIRDAYDAGEFAALPGFGQPIPGIDGPDDELWWIKDKLRREQLSLLPPALQILLDVERALGRIWKLGHESAVRREVAAINDKIRQANFAAVSGPPSTQMPLDIEDIVARWKVRKS